jgi:hypothetical protein
MHDIAYTCVADTIAHIIWFVLFTNAMERMVGFAQYSGARALSSAGLPACDDEQQYADEACMAKLMHNACSQHV